MITITLITNYILPTFIGLVFLLINLKRLKSIKVMKAPDDCKSLIRWRIVVTLDKIFYGNYRWVSGITFGYFIFIETYSDCLYRHESRHTYQQELLGFVFFILYLAFYLYLSLKYDAKTSYKEIPFEKDAVKYSLKKI